MDDLIILKELSGNPPPKLNALQEPLAPHAETLAFAWFVIWCSVACIIIAIYLRAYARHRREKSRP